MTTLHYHRLYQISSLEVNLSLEDMKQLCVDRRHIHTGIPYPKTNNQTRFILTMIKASRDIWIRLGQFGSKFLNF